MGGGLGNSFDIRDLKKLEEKAKKELSSGKKNVFISFSHEDMDEVNLLRGQAKNDKNDLEFSDYSVKEPFNSDNADYIRRKITEKIEKTSVTLVYITKDAAKSDWVKWEVEKSLKMGKGVVAVYQGDKASQMPSFITDNGIKSVQWNHDAMTKAIDEASKKRN